MKKIILIIGLLTALTNFAIAQTEQRLINQQSVGYFLNVGVPYYDLPEGETYTPILVGLLYYFPFWKTDGVFNMGLGAAPHFGIGITDKVNQELGLNAQLNFNFSLSEVAMLSFRVTSGPHFITVQTRRQAEGYIFSDNFLLVYRQRVNKFNWGLQAGWRHISNAGLQQPNLGIDNIMFGLEFGWLLN